MATIAIYSLKGGVGKTTLAVNLAACAAASSRRTLLWDLDPQAASSWIIGKPKTRDRARAVFTQDVDAAKLIRPTGIDRLDLLPADASLRELDLTLNDLGKKKRLAKLLARLDGYDRAILDCPPGLTETAEQVARAADLIVVPVVPSALAQRAYEEVERHLGKRAKILPVHVMVDRRRLLHRTAVEANPDWPAIPMASAIEAAAAARQPLNAVAPRSPASRAFETLWQRIERCLDT